MLKRSVTFVAALRFAPLSCGFVVFLLFWGSGACSSELDLGSNVLWSARHEGNTFDEWSGPPGGGANSDPPPNMIEISAEHAHRGGFAAKLTVDAPVSGGQASAGLSRINGLPTEAYYSAWYYLPRSVTVGTFWVIFKIRARDVVDDPTTDRELFDLDLANLPSGEMTLRLYDHRSGDVPLDVEPPVVPVGRWFQVEAFYRNAADTTGRVTYWLDGNMIVDVAGKPTGPTAWVQWVAGSAAQDLTPATEVLYIDDAAVSLSRVGPHGILAR